MSICNRFSAAAVAAFVCVVPVFAQTATVTGTVRALSGRPVPAAAIRAADGAASTASDSGGRFRLSVIAGQATQLVFVAPGFSAETVSVPALAANEQRTLSVMMTPLARLAVSEIVAERDRPLMNTGDAATGGAVERAELVALPTDARNPVSLAYTIPGVAQARAYFGDAPKLSIGGANALYTTYTLDGLDNNEGFLGGPRVEFPLSALSRLEVLTNSYPVTMGRSPSGVVSYESRAGGSRWSGETFAYSRPGIPFDAPASLVPAGQSEDDFRRAQRGFRRTQLGASGGGPLATDRTFGFGALEYTSENEDRISSTARAKFLGRELRETWKAFGRVDHGWTPDQTTTLRFALSHQARAGEGSGIVAPEADITTVRFGTQANATQFSAWNGGRASNTASVQLSTFKWDFPPTHNNLNTPQVTILDRDSIPIGVVGSSNFVFDESELQAQFRDIVQWQIGARHAVTAGVDVTSSSFRLTGSSTNPAGSYEVVNNGDIPGRDGRFALADIPADVFVRSYTIDAAQKQVNLRQSLYGAFIEDRWRPTASLTLRAGLRWDYDDITSRGASSADLNNFQPRASFSWLNTPMSVIRGGVGLYAGKLPYAVFSDAVQFGPDGNQTVTFNGAQAPKFLEGPKAVDLDRSALPAHEIREMFARGIRQPMSTQLTLGYQRQLGDRASASIDVAYVDTRDLPRSWDLNAQSAAIGPSDTLGVPLAVGDALRPVDPVAGSYRRHTTTESGGRSTYAGLDAAFRYRATNDLLLDANWTWSHAITNTEDINFNASVANDFDGDRADANNDRRHKVSGRATWTGVRRLSVSGIADWQTGTPINRVAYFRDLTGSGGAFGDGFIGNYQRFFGVPRNGERLPDAMLVSLSSAYEFTFGGSTLVARGDVFNLFNWENVAGFATGVGGGGSATQVGHPGDPIAFTTAGPPRQFQFSVAWRF